MKLQRILPAAAVGLALLAANVSAYRLIGATRASNQTFISASAVSFPPANAYRTALGTVESRFFFEQPSEMWFTMQYDDASVGMNNGQNEIWFSSDSSFSPAITFWWTSGSTMVESDMVFYNGLGWTTSSFKTSSFAYGGTARWFEPTAVHEFGHSAGLAHEEREYNIMGTDWDHVSCNGLNLRSYVGEDACDGLVAMYGPYSGGTLDDLGVSFFRYLSFSGEYSTHRQSQMYDFSGFLLPSVAFSGQRRYDVGVGETVQAEFTLENNGEDFHNASVGIYVSTDSTIDTGDRLISSHVVGLGRANVLEWSVNVTLPTDLNVGQTYYLGAYINNDFAVGEQTFSNNAAYHVVQLVCETPGSMSFFNSGTNPASLSGSLISVGDPFTLSVNLATTGHTFALPFGFDTPVSVPLSGGQVLLCVDGGSGEVLGLTQRTGPIANWSAGVPSSAFLCGFFFSAQAIHFGGVTPFRLSNALDYVVGG